MLIQEAIVRKKIVFPNLDGLRLFCFLAVFLFHAFHTDSSEIASSPLYRMVRHLVRHGDLGVNFFFVLSGFLITYLLLEEKRSCGRIHIGYFYARRMLRIWPLYMACVAFGFLGFPLLKRLAGVEPNETANPAMYFLFLGNFDVIASGLPDAGVLGVLWSVAVEEQFYLVWPLLLAASPQGRELWVLISVLATSILFRSMHSDYPTLTYHTLSVVGDMAVGAVAAHMAMYSKSIIDRIRGARPICIVLLYVSAAGLFLLDLGFLKPFDRLVPALIFATIILEQNHSRFSLFKVGDSQVFTGLGQRTYGMYCLHMVGNVSALQIARLAHLDASLWHVLLLVPLLSLSITIVMSEVSYRYFEHPFLALKTRFQFVVRD